jgi:hypothetical protein
VPFEALGDRLARPRRLAATLVAQAQPEPGLVVDLGAFQGEFLEAFLAQFPRAAGQWTDAGEGTRPVAEERLAPYGPRVTYRIGCPGRDLTDGSIPQDTNVLITSWVSSHRDAAGTAEVYAAAHSLLAPGGCLVHLEHVGFTDPAEEQRVLNAWPGYHVLWEGPPPHHDRPIATLEQHLAALRAAKFTDLQIAWHSLATYLFICRKAA